MKFPAELAKAVVRELLPVLRPCCMADASGEAWLRVAGSLRRRRAEVSDVELVYVPASGPVQTGLFVEVGNLMDAALERLVLERVIEPRVLARGGVAWGAKNKLAVHVASGVPLDFFATSAPCFWNYLVCRTGSREHNIKLAMSAAERGLKWHPYHDGFEVVDVARACHALGRDDLTMGRFVVARDEREVLALAGLPWAEPWQR